MCSLYLALDGFNVFVGGASLVASDKILTLASAVKNYKSASDGTCQEEIKPRYDLFVVCGSVNLQVRQNILIDKVIERQNPNSPTYV